MKTNKLITGALIGSALILSACAEVKANKNFTEQASTNGSQAYLQAKMSVSVYKPSGELVYTDSNPNSSLKMQAGQSYRFELNVTGAPDSTSYSVQATNIDSVAGQTSSFALVPGSNSITIPTQGNYSFKVQAVAPNMQPLVKYYQASVSCDSPTFTAASLNPNAISVGNNGMNLYTFSSSGVTAGANGKAPYQCAWDPTGTGIVDSDFISCDQSLSKFYVNLVSTRNVGLVVRDACNTTFTVAKAVNLAYQEPSMPGNVFIFGQVSGATGIAAGDSRVDGVVYLATNTSGHNIVQPTYEQKTFTIEAWQNYGMPSSEKFGMRISLSGMTDNINVANGTGTVSAANAKIKSVTFKTDQAGDQAPSISFSGANCTLSNQGAKVQFISGQPCAGGQTGDNNKATVEVWGHYFCTGLSATGGTINIQGDFDGYDDLVDNCSGGGGGGGGVAPINL